MTCAATLLGEHVYREFRLLDRRGKPTARELRCACGARPPDPEAVLAALSASEAALRGQRLEAAQLIAQMAI